MEEALKTFFVLLATIVIYVVMKKIYVICPIPLFLPVLTSSILIIVILKFYNVSYETYMAGGKWLDLLLGPAVVALAYPLYNQKQRILKYKGPIIGGVLIGLATGILSGIFFSIMLGISKSFLLSLLPKSMTTPVAIQISTGLGGIPSVTVACVMVAGISGAILGPIILKLFCINSSLGRGIAFGSASHAIGTSKAMEYGEATFSTSTVSMTLTALFGSIFISIITKFFI
ncbi:LrgB family protein [Peribacillus sp. NPDC058002]|uniref:LrgB family protein n=1 Tax=Peribacillus sp. NPDC058002 TaxID=3346301 RepID=UPI0036DEEB74